MAKIFRTEELSINGDEIRISAPSGKDNLEFRTSDGNLLTSVSSLMLKDVSHDSDVSSLNKVATTQASDTDSDISSLNKVTDSDISSLNVVTDSDISSLNVVTDSDISSLNVVTDSDISSLEKIVEINDIVAEEVAFSASLSTETLNGTVDAYDATNALVYVKFSKTFSAAPRVIGIMKSASGNPIIGCQLVSVDTTYAVFALSDDIALTDTAADQYSIQVLASVDGGKVLPS